MEEEIDLKKEELYQLTTSIDDVQNKIDRVHSYSSTPEFLNPLTTQYLSGLVTDIFDTTSQTLMNN